MPATDRVTIFNQAAAGEPVYNVNSRVPLTACLGDESSGSLVVQNLWGFHKEIAAGSTLAIGSSKTFVARGHYIWFRFNSKSSSGGVRIRGRYYNDDGSRDGSPTNEDFDMSSATAGDVFVSTSRLADNASIDALSGFIGNIDYGLVSPFHAHGMIEVVESARMQWEPSDDSNWRMDWSVQLWKPGASGGLTDLLSTADQTSFRHTDTLIRAAEGEPGNAHVLDIDQQFDIEENEGIVVAVARRNILSCNVLATGYRI